MRKHSKDMTRYLPGAILILSGVLVVAFPMLLVAFVSGLLILGGIVAIAIAHKVKRFHDATGQLYDSGPFYGAFWNDDEKVFHQHWWH